MESLKELESDETYEIEIEHIQDVNIPRSWSMLSYAGEKRVPPADEPDSGYWPTFFLKRDEEGNFLDGEGKKIAFNIRRPDQGIDFEGKQLEEVKETLENLTPRQKRIATYWGDGPPTKQWTPIIDILIDTYGISAPRAARILAATQAAINDTFVVTWYFKFLWQVPRPNQLDQDLATLLCTPYHPSYPSGHAAVAGCAEVVLSYFFEAEAERLRELAEECAISRLYGGVHYPIDNDEGLRLGRQIGHIVVDILKEQCSIGGNQIDYPITENLNAELIPPPYRQAIPFDRDMKCNSKTIDDCNKTYGEIFSTAEEYESEE